MRVPQSTIWREGKLTVTMFSYRRGIWFHLFGDMILAAVCLPLLAWAANNRLSGPRPYVNIHHLCRRLLSPKRIGSWSPVSKPRTLFPIRLLAFPARKSGAESSLTLRFEQQLREENADARNGKHRQLSSTAVAAPT